MSDLRRLREPEQAAKAALWSLARRITELDGEIKLLDQQLAQLIAEAAPITINRLAVGTGHAATLLVTAGQNIERLRHEASFAALCAAGPISRLKRAHRSPPPQLRRRPRRQPRTARDRGLPPAPLRTHRAYAARRTAEGKTKTEIIRCLKRYIARELYHTLRADLADLGPPTMPPQRTVTINCGAGPIGTTRTRRRRRTRT